MPLFRVFHLFYFFFLFFRFTFLSLCHSVLSCHISVLFSSIFTKLYYSSPLSGQKSGVQAISAALNAHANLNGRSQSPYAANVSIVISEIIFIFFKKKFGVVCIVCLRCL